MIVGVQISSNDGLPRCIWHSMNERCSPLKMKRPETLVTNVVVAVSANSGARHFPPKTRTGDTLEPISSLRRELFLPEAWQCPRVHFPHALVGTKGCFSCIRICIDRTKNASLATWQERSNCLPTNNSNQLRDRCLWIPFLSTVSRTDLCHVLAYVVLDIIITSELCICKISITIYGCIRFRVTGSRLRT